MTQEKNIQVRTQLEVAQPPSRVFEAIINPEQMSQYFISSGTGPMQSGETVHWKFERGGGIEVKVERIEPDKWVSFFWSAGGSKEFVTMELTPVGDNGTLLKITESEWLPDEKGIAKGMQQTQGWMHFLCCMKAYLEYGIHLRKSRVVGKKES